MFMNDIYIYIYIYDFCIYFQYFLFLYAQNSKDTVDDLECEHGVDNEFRSAMQSDLDLDDNVTTQSLEEVQSVVKIQSRELDFDNTRTCSLMQTIIHSMVRILTLYLIICILLCHDFGFQSVPSRSENELFTRY